MMHDAEYPNVYDICDIIRSRNFSKYPIIRIRRYKKQSAEFDENVKLEFNEPCEVDYEAFEGTLIKSIKIDKVLSIGESAFANCGNLSDLHHLGIDANTPLGNGCFYMVGHKSRAVMLPRMTKEQISISKVTVEFDKNVLGFKPRRDVVFGAPDNETRDLLLTFGVRVWDEEFEIQDVKAEASTALMKLDDNGLGPVEISFRGKTLFVADAHADIKDALKRGPVCLIDSFFDPVEAMKHIEDAIYRLFENDHPSDGN